MTEDMNTKAVGVKGKAIPTQTWIGPEGSRRLRLSDFETIGTRRWKVVCPTHRPPLPPGDTLLLTSVRG